MYTFALVNTEIITFFSLKLTYLGAICLSIEQKMTTCTYTWSKNICRKGCACPLTVLIGIHLCRYGATLHSKLLLQNFI